MDGKDCSENLKNKDEKAQVTILSIRANACGGSHHVPFLDARTYTVSLGEICTLAWRRMSRMGWVSAGCGWMTKLATVEGASALSAGPGRRHQISFRSCSWLPTPSSSSPSHGKCGVPVSQRLDPPIFLMPRSRLATLCVLLLP